MRDLLAPENAEALAPVAKSRALLGFDFDGTLAPIVADRDGARMRPRTAELFAIVCRLYPCAVISGRSRRDVSSRLEGAHVKYVVGNHGLEPRDGFDELGGDVARARTLLAAALAELPGVDVEDKVLSLALHYRSAPQMRDARDAIHRAVAALPVRMRIVPGKLVVNVVPELGPNKGDALLALVGAERADVALYVGDDVTDEDVFAHDEFDRLLTVRIGASRTSAAAFYVHDQTEIDVLLTMLIALRSR